LSRSVTPVRPRRAANEPLSFRRFANWRTAGATLAIAALGAGLAGAVAGIGAAQDLGHSTAAVVTTVEPGVTQPSAFHREAPATSRSKAREALPSSAVNDRAAQRAQTLAGDRAATAAAAQKKAVQRRAASLKATKKATKKQAAMLAGLSASGASGGTVKKLAALGTSGKSCLPLPKGYSIAADFGDTGSWSRYHTGIDFSDAIGTPILAPAAGVVTNAGLGKASAWAGQYVTIQYPNGMSTLMAHMSTVSVKVGDVVKPCQPVGAVGMTGRTFGPHLHFELYPSGVTPGEIYQAIDPAPWLRGKHLRP
jgi:murein DD-endopeptidase MepM/ murein hydrolase activator NlpD